MGRGGPAQWQTGPSTSCIPPGRTGLSGSYLNHALCPRGPLGLEGKNVQDFRGAQSQGPAPSRTGQQSNIHQH